MKSDYSLVIFYSSKFARQYRKLPNKIQKLAEKKEKIFRQNPFEPRLKTHKLHGLLKGFWSFYINLEYRIIFKFADKNIVRFYTIGKHDIYQ